eukprot:TRINITY_DN12557_c0_g1_i1.p3 TRINITY_DN12557_c0_g1~~TRINITY_DN12557_c0_g1_i1.p3  ORF type:complete len:112 (-),score=3.11 TRINITY_DN12557_c0_g1_i1:739-1074(-)
MIRRPPRSTLSSSSAASDVYKRQVYRHVPPRRSMVWLALTSVYPAPSLPPAMVLLWYAPKLTTGVPTPPPTTSTRAYRTEAVIGMACVRLDSRGLDALCARMAMADRGTPA